MRRRRTVLTSSMLLGVWLSVASSAVAQTQTLPGSARDGKPVSQGKTEIAQEKFYRAERLDLEEQKNATELSISAGGLLTSGNSRTYAATAAGRFRLRRTDDQITATVAGNYGMSAQAGESWQTTVENVQGLERYDRFVDDVAFFLASQQRRDRFQGLDLRFQVDPGVAYYFVNQGAELLWLEAGYDLRYDVRRDDALTQVDADGAPVLDAAGNPIRLDKTTTVHSGRAFLGYEVKLNDTVQFTAGLEYIQSVADIHVYRINADAAIQAKLRQSLAVALSFMERYENRPLPGKEELDTTTSVSLVYSFF